MSRPVEFINKDTQRRALLAALQIAPISTIEAREVLGIAHVAGRLMELRRLGWPISTERRTVHDAQGRPHTCALYVLQGPQTQSEAAHD